MGNVAQSFLLRTGRPVDVTQTPHTSAVLNMATVAARRSTAPVTPASTTIPDRPKTLRNIPDSRKGFFLGMESGGDVKFFSPGGPV